MTDGYKGSKCRQFFKNQANKLIRRSKNVPDGGSYRKFFDSWNICDYKWKLDPSDKLFKEKPWIYNRK